MIRRARDARARRSRAAQQLRVRPAHAVRAGPAVRAAARGASETDWAKPHDKLLGIRLGHFAGFYRGSWRVNDFMWGRLDAAARIVDMLVARARVSQLGGDAAGPATTAVDGARRRADAGERRRTADAAAARRRSPTCRPATRGLSATCRPGSRRRSKHDLTRGAGDRGQLTRMVCTRAAQLEIFARRAAACSTQASRPTRARRRHARARARRRRGAALEALRTDGARLPERLVADDEVTSDARAADERARRRSSRWARCGRQSCRDGARLFALRALLLPVAGTVAADVAAAGCVVAGVLGRGDAPRRAGSSRPQRTPSRCR